MVPRPLCKAGRWGMFRRLCDPLGGGQFEGEFNRVVVSVFRPVSEVGLPGKFWMEGEDSVDVADLSVWDKKIVE